ncbi:hypothetical protein SRRS_14920 [Sporomusa rhizae]|uniref:DUF2326 domain-containing protein n=1 Tax=Sporomusa rhizae TaxID=357999 RepID=UPI00352B2494
MLYEIICDEFKQKRVEFHAGLNTVLGDNFGSNSIGKSTFLMIIDFVFGGKDYVMLSSDVQKNIGNHLIKYCFIFNGVKYFFSRSTDDFENVNNCDEKYRVKMVTSRDSYCAFLKNMYKISLENISFRDIVGRYSRVYGKENLDEKHPLHRVHNEKAGDPTNALLKLFDLYRFIEELDKLLKRKESELDTYKKAQRYQYVSSIGKRKYIQNIKELELLFNGKEQLAKDLDENLLDLDSIKTDELLKLKNEISIAKRHRSRLYSQLRMISLNIDENMNLKSEKFDDLQIFFPNVSIKRISEIEQFHKEIGLVLKSELKQKKSELERLISIAQSHIDNLEESVKAVSQSSNLSKVVLMKYSNIQKQIETLENENKSFEKLGSLTEAKIDAKQRRDNMKLEQLQNLQTLINAKMLEINDLIYSETKKPPTIIFNNNQYIFFTADDTGTGTSYKSMIVYDLSILELTQLPILIHDSIVLKQISDIAIEKIFLIYNSVDKQIFISFDKISAYTLQSQEILKATKVLELSVGNELFGRSWNDKKLS